MVNASIVIPTLNEEKYLPKLLESIKRQTFKDYEVIVADAGSTDKTKKIAKKYGAKVVKGGMPGPGRNRGAEVAKGKILFFFDSDVKLPPNFLKNAYDQMQERYLDLATCEFRPLSNLYIDKVMHDFANSSIKLSQFNNPHAPGFCIFVTKRLFDRVSGFDETIKLAEDHDFVKRASKVRPLRTLNKVKIYVSVRRLRKEGRLVLIGKYAKAEYFRMTRGELRDDSVEYEFANFTKKMDKPLEKKLGDIEKSINKMNMDYNKFRKQMKAGPKRKVVLKNLKLQLENSRRNMKKFFVKRKRKK